MATTHLMNDVQDEARLEIRYKSRAVTIPYSLLVRLAGWVARGRPSASSRYYAEWKELQSFLDKLQPVMYDDSRKLGMPPGGIRDELAA